MFPMPDLMAGSDERNIAIDQVGIRGLRYPLTFVDADGVAQPTIAVANVYVALPEDRKGTHMSRLVALLESVSAPGEPPLSVHSLRDLLDTLVVLLEAPGGRIELAFPYFIRKSAPVSGVASRLDYEVKLAGELDGGAYRQTADRRGSGHFALSVLEGDLGVRSAQPALDRDDDRRARRAALPDRDDPHRRGRGLLRALRAAQAR